MPRVFRPAALLPPSVLAIVMMASCAYFFPSCETIPGCPEGQILCNNLTCSDLMSDPFNCGECNNSCSAGLNCVPDGGPDGGAACGCTLAGQILFDGACLDLSLDPENCGAIGNACRLDQACLDGGCGCLIPSALSAFLDGGSNECPTDGGTACTDLLNDPQNCGGCGLICAASCGLGSCDGGSSDGGSGDGGSSDGGDDGGIDGG
jgi:hypothetical protein